MYAKCTWLYFSSLMLIKKNPAKAGMLIKTLQNTYSRSTHPNLLWKCEHKPASYHKVLRVCLCFVTASGTRDFSSQDSSVGSRAPRPGGGRGRAPVARGARNAVWVRMSSRSYASRGCLTGRLAEPSRREETGRQWQVRRKGTGRRL